MGQRPPYETFTGLTCKGSIALGTGCNVCEKCKWERAQGAVKIEPPRKDIRTAPPFDAQFRGAQFFAVSGGQWFYVNHADTWQTCPPPFPAEAT